VRIIDALQYHEKHGEVCPAGWQKGDKGMVASTAGVAQYLENHAEAL
jgi:peroxiredoxin (alkyl hydroperoxide reductase subunit C)